MMHIAVPQIKELGEKTRLTATVTVDDVANEIWFETDYEYGKYFCCERSDALFVMLFYYAMKNHHDMVFDGEITEQLYYGIKNNLIPAMCSEDSRFYNPEIKCKTTNEVFKTEGIAATGISCGVDSLSTLYANSGDRCPENFKVKYLTFFNAGAACFPDGSKVLTWNGTDIEKIRIENAQRLAMELGMPLIIVDSNVSEFLKIDYVYTHTHRNCAMAMLFQKLISKYYYASTGYGFEKPNMTMEDTAGEADIISLHYISNGIISFYSSLDYCRRFEKTDMISDYPIAQKYLNVCIKEGENCGKCPKCLRTLTTLDALDKLENFSLVFNLDEYRKNRKKYLLYTVWNKDEHFYDDIYRVLKRKKSYSLWMIIYGHMLMVAKKLKRKIKGIK